MTADSLPGEQAVDALTGKRRIAFAAFVDDSQLGDLVVLLRSLALTNPGLCEDFVVLHDGLPPAAVERIRALHPRIVPRPGDRVLDAFRIRDYDTVIVLDPRMVVPGDLGELLRQREGLAALAQFSGDGGRGARRDGRRTLAPGPLVIQREYLSDVFCALLDAEGPDTEEAPDYTACLALLDAVLDGDFVPLNAGLTGAPGAHLASDTPDTSETSDAEFHAAYLALKGAAHHDLLVHYGTPHVARTGDLDSARKVATAHIAAGEYQEAVDLLRSVRIPVDAAWPHEVLGHALMSVSRYEEARAQLLLASAAPKRAATAFGRLAQIAWVHGDDELARTYASEGLAVDPTHPTSRQFLDRTRGGAPSPQEGPAEEQLAHVAFYMPQQGNAGDKLLPESVRLTFDSDTGPRRWHSIHAHRLFDEAALARVNARRGLVIGGGGLFIPDTAPNGNSGWQWNVPNALLKRVDVPVVVYAVGFNAFDGQSYRHRLFNSGLCQLVEKSAFFGLRNHGSIEKVRALLPTSLHDKVRFQPCPTTVTRQLVDGWTDPAERENTVLINAAYDRAGLRFGHDYAHFLAEMAKAVRALGAHAEVKCVAHSLDDERIAFDLRREHGISLPVIPMYGFENDAIRDTYARTRLVIGMRGHAGMIPFGCGTPIISLISHPKMAYFLADIDRPEWGVSVHDKNLGAQLTERAVAVLADHAAAVADVHGRQQELWKVTQANAADLRAILGNAPVPVH
ncbi:polysaccharide pyruvyl transferase [Streptomyces sp. 150FB]|uniref:polysaccharide pyruvyl transferase family protein n=1 Tax=Streptomyces sp. 150FB TaxID=1576605 RepID=UPI0005893552|nr:polysaccharide pyruvyl transferase family protein [Streptomyces sp. 150FB]KIF76352.1 polysaccharide pyruvyl transferase [Streptomyces sp. 150FB]